MDAIIPRVVITIFGIPITSTVISTWVVMVIIMVSVMLIEKYLPTLSDMIGDFIADIVNSIMGVNTIDPYLPVLGALAIFIAVSNSAGMFPLISAPTSDINTTIALSLVVFFAVHVYGIQSKGLAKYLKEFADPIFLLPLEIVGQFSRTLSLTLRLFGNILSGELIAAIIFSLVPLIAPLPLVGLGLLVGLLQAYVFTSLASLYISSAVITEK